MMKRNLATAVTIVVLGCGGAKSPAPPAPAPTTAPTAMSPDECTAKGGYVKGDIGDGKVACTDGETDLGRVNQGIEGAVCCVAKKP